MHLVKTPAIEAAASVNSNSNMWRTELEVIRVSGTIRCMALIPWAASINNTLFHPKPCLVEVVSGSFPRKAINEAQQPGYPNSFIQLFDAEVVVGCS